MGFRAGISYGLEVEWLGLECMCLSTRSWVVLCSYFTVSFLLARGFGQLLWERACARRSGHDKAWNTRSLETSKVAWMATGIWKGKRSMSYTLGHNHPDLSIPSFVRRSFE